MISDRLKDMVNNFDDGYYHLTKDLARYPDAIIYVVYSMRGPGKTTSALAHMLFTGSKFLYMKRTKDDVQLLCNEMLSDVQPFSPINRICGLDIRPSMIDKEHAFAGFYDFTEDEDGKPVPVGAPYGYCMSFNGMKSFKGMNFDFVDFIIFDEFIPQPLERISAKEGEALLSLYETCMRDRIARGLPPIKLILFGNAENISTPVTRELQIIDDMALCCVQDKPYVYLKDRGILIHHIKPYEVPKAGENAGSAMHKAMKGTKWAKKSYEGQFTYNDFSNVGKQRIEGYRPLYKCFYQNKYIYIYINNDNCYYVTYSRSNQKIDIYDLDTDGGAMAFFYDVVRPVQLAIIDGLAKFETYSLYDLFLNYKNYFKKF